MTARINTYIQYGVLSEWAEMLVQKGLSVTQLRSTPIDQLVAIYGIETHVARETKRLITRTPIEESILELLLDRSAYTCCVCANERRAIGYVIHHIQEYSISQDNSYFNLVVLCPNCHDSAHSGSHLTRSLTPEDLHRLKSKWERMVEVAKAQRAAGAGSVEEIDYINIPRIDELSRSILRRPCDSVETSDGLRVTPGNGDGISAPLHEYVGTEVRWKYFEHFKQILRFKEFKNLDTLLTEKELLAPSFLGTFCYYVGGVYGAKIKWPPDKTRPSASLHFKRGRYHVRWPIIPCYITSSTGFGRLTSRTVHLIYGRIRNADKKKVDGITCISIEIRPYVIGWPAETVDRTPLVRHMQALHNEEEQDSEANIVANEGVLTQTDAESNGGTNEREAD